MSDRTPGTPVAPPDAAVPKQFLRWHRRILGFCLAIFALELGLFLLVFPWMSNWDLSWIPAHSPRFTEIWMSGYFRGALSGMGLLNLWIGVAELLKQVRFLARRS